PGVGAGGRDLASLDDQIEIAVAAAAELATGGAGVLAIASRRVGAARLRLTGLAGGGVDVGIAAPGDRALQRAGVDAVAGRRVRAVGRHLAGLAQSAVHVAVAAPGREAGLAHRGGGRPVAVGGVAAPQVVAGLTCRAVDVTVAAARGPAAHATLGVLAVANRGVGAAHHVAGLARGGVDVAIPAFGEVTGLASRGRRSAVAVRGVGAAAHVALLARGAV